jgi:hypothetical protein
MNGDITRDSFDPYRHYTRVVMQQGRVQLDADWNEQVAITERYLRTLAADLIGPFGGPQNDCGFAVGADRSVLTGMTGKYDLPLDQARLDEIGKRLDGGDFLIGPGRYYVHGLLAENEEPITYSEQKGYPFDGETTLEKVRGASTFLIYLDVWERSVTGAENPDLVEVALGSADTAARAQLVWQVKILRGTTAMSCSSTAALERARLSFLRARASQPASQPDACVIDPAARYRGAENQLYRVEIHRGGPARPSGATAGGATFKWSRENGSVVFPVRDLAEDTGKSETTAELATLGRDRRLGLATDDWVEVVDDGYVLRAAAEPLHLVERIDRDGLKAVLAGLGPADTGQDQALHPLLRRWDHDASDPAASDQGALLVTEAADAASGWIELEDGVQVQFPVSAVAGEPNEYRTGDYWLIPARTATGDVIWPRRQVGGQVEWEARPPNGVEHHYAPLAIASADDNGHWTFVSPDCRKQFAALPGLGTP